MKFKFFRQLGSNECGIACIRMIVHNYGYSYSYKQIKTLCNDHTRHGVYVQEVVECLRNLEFEACATIVKDVDLVKAPLPIILFWKESHFVVIYKIDIKKNTIYIADPAYGKIKLKFSDITYYTENKNNIVVILANPLSGLSEKKVKIQKDKNQLLFFFKEFFFLSKKHKYKIIFSIILLVIAIVCNWLIPIILQKIVDDGVIVENLHVVKLLVVSQIIVYFGFLSTNSISRLLITNINFQISIDILKRYLYKLVKLPLKLFDSKLNTEYIQRMDDQVVIQNFSTIQIIDIFLSFLNVLVFSLILLYYSLTSFTICILLTAISVIWVLLFLKKRKELNYARFYASSEAKNNLLEIISGMKEIKINNSQYKKINKWEILQKNINNISIKNIYINFYQTMGSSSINISRDILINFICAYSVINGSMTLGTMMTISFILGNLSASINQIVNNISISQDALNAAERLADVYTQEEEKNTENFQIEKIDKEICLSNVSFKYNRFSSKYILNNININILKGKTTAIVGDSGSGKTTLLKLLLAFYIPQKGNILIDNINLATINPNSWRDLCGAVLQDGYIFSDTILENIALNDEHPDETRVINACKIACINDFIETLPLKYKTIIGNAGLEFSAGQKQRILIARAIYKNPEIIVFDEATSALDSENELKIHNNLTKFFDTKTVIIVAHRLSTVKNADKIVVLNNGEIVEIGNHNELIEKKKYYYNLVRNQID